MREFFKGWRRKAACVLLVLACVVMRESMWSRIQRSEFFYNPRDNEWHTIRSDGQALRFLYDAWSESGQIRVEQEIVIPYVVIVLPITLVSAYLFLWKPRKVK